MRMVRVIVALIAMLHVTACTRSSTLSQNTKQLRLSIPEEPLTLDPRKGGDAISSHLHFLLFEGLTRLNEDGSTGPAQAHEIDISDDKMTYVFHLGKTKWSDGSPVTAYDFEKAWKDILSPTFPAPNAHLLYPIKGAEMAKKGKISLAEVGIRAPNANTLEVELERPTPYFLQLISFCVFFPIHTMTESQHPDWAVQAPKHFVCNGPFILSQWKHHNELLVEKNPQYRDLNEVKLDSIHFSIIGSDMTALQMFENHELDFVGHPFCSLPPDAILSLHANHKLNTSPAAASTFITFNTMAFPFNNENLRKAFAYAINRDEIVHNITQLDEVVATSAVPPALKNGKSPVFFEDNNPTLARHYLSLALQELGITKKELCELTYYYSTTENHHKVAQVLQGQWQAALGIKVQLQGIEHKTLLDLLSKRNYTFAQSIWRAQYPDPMNILERFKYRDNVKNYPGWENSTYIQLLDDSLLQSGETRTTTLEKAEEIFLSELPLVPLYHWTLCYLKSSDLKEIHFSPVGGIFFERLDLEHVNDTR